MKRAMRRCISSFYFLAKWLHFCCKESEMTKEETVLMAMAAAGGKIFTPVQVQKLLFLIDERAADVIGGRQFNFEPYDYGPFDSTVYATLQSLAVNGDVEIIRDPSLRWRKYS